MKTRFSLFIRNALLLMIVFVAMPLAKAQQGQLPPLIDRELFFGDPEIAGAQLSPDGKYISFIKPYKNTRNVWVKGIDEPFDKAKPVTADTRRPIPGYFWTRDSRFILFVQDQAGDENYNVYAVNPADPPAAGADVPAARNITGAKGVRTALYSLPRTDPDVLYMGLNDRDPAWHDLYRVKISTGERTLIRKNTERITSWIFDLKDQLRLATRAADNGDTEVLRVDESGFTKVYSCNVLETCGPVRFQKDGRHVYMITNKGEGIDLVRLTSFDPATGKEELVESDPLNRVDFGGVVFSEVSDELVATSYVDDRVRIYFRDKGFKKDYELVRKRLGDLEISFGSHTKDERLWIVGAGSDIEPGSTYIFDRKTKKLTLQYRVREKLVRDYLVPMKPIRYKSSDGLEIPAYLTLPKGVPAKSLPLLVTPHGGPWARDTWGYRASAQFYANRGYAVLMPNFRGSTGYGKKFLDAGNKEWGGKMQDDLTWGVKYLVAEGVADPKRIGITGGSYGGYATLAGVTFTPDLYAVAVSIVGPSNLITLMESIPPYWEPIRKTFHVRMGDPTTPDGKAQLERQSPLNSADKIKTPLLVVQGANDPRVKKAESDQIVVALRDRGFPVEYIVAPDEGHGFARPVNNMAMFALSEKFLAKYLGGRYQESMTPEVSQRLKEIMVDVKTVEKPKRVNLSAVGVPKPATDLRAGTATYAVRIDVGGQKMEMSLQQEIHEEGGNWVATESAKTPGGEVIDKSTIEKGTLVMLKRSIRQGPVAIDFEVKDGKAVGEMKMAAQSKPIAAELNGALFADGAGSNAVIAALPLAEGYATSFRNFDVQTQKVKVMEFKVVGSEQVTVPAGTFDAFKAEMISTDDNSKTTMWISKSDRKALKIAGTVPRLNGATVTYELQK
jgi:dipeptidyl aminopeptidase/acylaminoacyl peptidase